MSTEHSSSTGGDGRRVDAPRADGPRVDDQGADGRRVDAPRADGPRVDDQGADGPRVDDRAAPPAGRPARRGMSGTAKNMVYTALAAFGLSLLWWALMPGEDEIPPPVVEITQVANYADSQSDWPVWVPQDLPTGWRATSVDFGPYTDGIVTWRVGYNSADKEYVAIAQGAEVTDAWVASLVRGGAAEGTLTATGPGGAAEWQKYAGQDQNTLVLPATRAREATTVVRGTASFEELADFIAHLEPWTGGADRPAS